MNLYRDVRYGIRLMGKRPLFSAAIILTLGVCIGAVTAVFSVVDATLLRPLPYPEPKRLFQVVLRSKFEGKSGLQHSQNGATWEVFHKSVKTIDLAVFSDSRTELNLSSGGDAAYVRQQRVSAGFFRVLGIPPSMGREFTTEEDIPNGPPVVILSHALWRRAFQGDPSVVGRGALIGGQTHVIVGVAAPGFTSSVEADLWTPLRPSRTGEGSGINYTVIGRLRHGVTWAQAESEVQSIGQSILQDRHLRPGATLQFGLMGLQQSMNSTLEAPLIIVFAATLLVLLIGCVNIAGMLLARGASRASEIATRMALGAGRADILRQLLSESFALAVAGGIVGIVLGYFSLEALRSMLPEEFASLKSATLDNRVLVGMAFVSMATSVVFGLFPALQAGRIEIRNAQAGRSVVGGRSFSRPALSTVQITIAVALLIGAGLLLRTFNHLWRLEPGLDSTNVMTAGFALRDARYAGNEQVNRLFREGLTRLQELRGVESAAVALSLPYERGLNSVFWKSTDSEAGQVRVTNLAYVTPQFFATLRIPVLRGRGITDADSRGSSPVIVVNEAFLRLHFREEDPIGMHLRSGRELLQIVGIVGNVQQQAGWGQFGPMGPIPAAYIPSTQVDDATFRLVHTWFSPSWIVRSAAPHAGLQRQIAEVLKAVDPLLPIAAFRTLDDLKARSLAWERFLATLLGTAAGLALLLALIGTYAMISNSVVERTREFGIRMALGATTGQMIRNSVKPGLVCAAIGLAIGIVLGRIGTPVLQGMLWGVTPADPATFLAVAIGVPVVAAVASLIPAMRIIRLDPARTLREE